MTREQLKAKFPRASEAFIKANSDGLGMGAVDRQEHPKSAPALVRDVSPKQSGQGSLGICVEIIGVRRRKLDGDNFQAGIKTLRDAIAKSLAIDDGSDAIQWHYGQIVSSGHPGTIVRISWS